MLCCVEENYFLLDVRKTNLSSYLFSTAIEKLEENQICLALFYIAVNFGDCLVSHNKLTPLSYTVSEENNIRGRE